MRHSGRDVLPAVDRNDGSRDAPRRVGHEEVGEAADVGNLREVTLRGAGGGLCEQFIEAIDAARGPRLDGARGDGVHPDPLGAEFRSHVAHRALERRLHRPHKVVVIDDPRRAIEGDREQRSAVRHQWLGQAGHAHEGMARHFHRLGKSGRAAIDHAAVQILARGEGDGMQDEVELVPALRQRAEDGLERAVLAQIAGQDVRAFEAFAQGPHMRFGLVVEVGDGEVGAGVAQGAGAAEGDGVLVGDADDETALAAQIERIGPVFVQRDGGQRRPRTDHLLGRRHHFRRAGDHGFAALVLQEAVEDAGAMLGALFAQRHARRDHVADAHGAAEPQVLAEIDGAWPRQLRAEHGGDERPTPHAMRDDAVEEIGLRVGRVEMRRVHVARNDGEQFDVALGQRARQARRIADGEFVEGAVLDGRGCAHGDVHRGLSFWITPGRRRNRGRASASGSLLRGSRRGAGRPGPACSGRRASGTTPATRSRPARACARARRRGSRSGCRACASPSGSGGGDGRARRRCRRCGRRWSGRRSVPHP